MPQLKPHPRSIGAAGTIDGERTKWTIEGVRGLVLDCLPDGSRSWVCRYQVGRGRAGRKQRDHRIGSFNENEADHLTYGQARDRAMELQTLAKRDGRDPLAESRRPSTQSTFDDIFSQWLEKHAQVKKRSWRNDRGRYNNHIKELLGSTIAQDLKRAEIIAALDDIAADVSPITANRCQAVISATLQWALDESLIETNPAYRIRKRGNENQRNRILSDDESRKLWNALDDGNPLERGIKLLWLTGQRRVEVATASAAIIHGLEWHIPSEVAKNDVPHIVPLASSAKALFDGWSPLQKEDLSKRMRAVADGLGIDDFVLHDLRHCCATGMAALGVPREIRERVQNQITGRNQSIAARYDQHEYLAEKRRALELWERRLLEIVEGRPASGERWTA